MHVRPSIANRLANFLKAAEELAAGEIIDIFPGPGYDCFCGCVGDGSSGFPVTLNPRDFPQEKLSAMVVYPIEFLMAKRHAMAYGNQSSLHPSN